MKKNIRSAFVILLMLNSMLSNGQIFKSFTKDPVKFPEELKKYMVSNKNFGNDLIADQLTSLWLTNTYSAAQKDSIILTANALLSKRGDPSPHFKNYLLTLISFDKMKHLPASFEQWQMAVIDMLKRNSVSLIVVNQLFEYTLGLLNDSTICKTSSTRWKLSKPDFKFSYSGKLSISVSKTSLICRIPSDSTSIHETSGTYFPLENIWVGRGGKFYWARARLNPDSVWADIQNYRINLKQSEFTIDSVSFHNLQYTKEVMLGRLFEKSGYLTDPKTAVYPQFSTYDKMVDLNDLYKNVQFRGLLCMNGRTLIGRGKVGKLAVLKILQNNVPLFFAHSKAFVFSEKLINSNEAAISLYLGVDSIYHPMVTFKYFINKEEASVIRSSEGVGQIPFFDSYHNYEMEVEMINWKRGNNQVSFRCLPGSARNRAIFKSSKFFDLDEFTALQGIDKVNPLVMLYNFSEVKRKGDNEFNAIDFAKDMKRYSDQVQRMLLNLSYKRFIDYDPQTQNITIKQKLRDNIAMSRGKQDYDILKFKSDTTTNTDNATLDLANFNLDIVCTDTTSVALIIQRKVKSISGTDTIKGDSIIPIRIKAKNKKVILKKNQDFSYSGELELGPFTFVGNNFYFDYANFKFSLDSVDYMLVKVSEKDKYGNLMGSRKQVLNKIYEISGDAYINDPLNKSGKKRKNLYPIFVCRSSAKVYYNDSTTQEIAYPKERFYYLLKPFTIDSLNDFSTSTWVIPGTFESGGILPTLTQDLTILKDTTFKFGNKQEVYSFGFDLRTGINNIPVYRGKGTFHNQIKLSMKGLIGNGICNYITSVTDGDRFKFYLDSMNVDAARFKVKLQEQPIEYTNARATKPFIHWEPYKDQLFASSRKTPIYLYDSLRINNRVDTIRLVGTLSVSPKGLYGRGKLNFINTDISSNSFTFYTKKFTSDKADFVIIEPKTNQFNFVTENVNFVINLKDTTGIFKANDASSIVKFPKNFYWSTLDQFKWDINKERITLTNPNRRLRTVPDTTGWSRIDKEDLFLEGSNYYSVAQGQDSLNFVSDSVIYDVPKLRFRAQHVKYIRVADATIYPSTEIVIEKNGVMNDLLKTNISANNKTRFHLIYDANVKLTGRFDFTGFGDYDYLDENSAVQKVHFDKIYVDSLTTFAVGEIKAENNFLLNPYFSFQGNIKLRADFQNLYFDGFTQIKHECNPLAISRFKFEGLIDPKKIYIPISKEISGMKKDTMYTSVYISTDSAHVYSAFLSPRKKASDISVMNANGYLYFNKKNSFYEVGSLEKLEDMNKKGNYLALQKDACLINSEGKFNLGVDLWQVKLSSAGTFKHDLIADVPEMNLMLGVDFFFSSSLLEMLAKALKANNDLEPIEMITKRFKKNYTEFAGLKNAEKLIKEVIKRGEYRMQKDLEHTLMFTDVNFIWNTATGSYQSQGALGVGLINGTQINKYVAGYIEIVQKKEHDIINIFLRLDAQNWVYFRHSDDVMQTVSSISDYNDAIDKAKEKNRVKKGVRGEPDYVYYTASTSTKDRFLSQFENVSTEEGDSLQNIKKVRLKDEKLSDTLFVVGEEDSTKVDEFIDTTKAKTAKEISDQFNKGQKNQTDLKDIKKKSKKEKKEEAVIPNLGTNEEKKKIEAKKEEAKKEEARKEELKKEEKKKKEDKKKIEKANEEKKNNNLFEEDKK